MADKYVSFSMKGLRLVGKSAFARALRLPRRCMYEVNTAAGTNSDLRRYIYGTDGLVLVDGVVSAQVVKQRKLLQASPSVVQLRCSATDMHSYSVFLLGVRIMLCNNTWSSSLHDASAAP